MEKREIDDISYKQFLENVVKNLTELRDIYNRIIVLMYNGVSSDSLRDFLIELDELRDEEIRMIDQYKNENYDIASIYERYINDFDIYTTTVFDFDDVVSIYSPNSSKFLRRRQANLLSTNFNFLDFKYNFLSDIEKKCLPIEIANMMDLYGNALCDDIYKMFIRNAYQEFLNNPRRNRMLLFYLMDFIIANPDLESYYINNDFDFEAEVILSNVLIREYGMATRKLKSDDVIIINDEMASSLVLNYNKYKNDSINATVMNIMIESVYAVTGNSKLEPYLSKEQKERSKDKKYLTFFN